MERDLKIEYKTSLTNNTNNTTTNKRNHTKYTKPMLSFPELGAANTGLVPNPKLGTVRGAGKKTNSIAAKTRTDGVSATA